MAKKKKYVNKKKPVKKQAKKNKKKPVTKKKQAKNKTVKRKKSSSAKKKFDDRKKKAKKAGELKMKLDKQGTIHDAQNELITFFKYQEKNRKDKEELKFYNKAKKALLQFNKIIRKKRNALAREGASGKNMVKNDLFLKTKKPIEIDVSGEIREALVKIYPRIFKKKEFYLNEIEYDYINNKIAYFSGKPYNFIIDTGFDKHYIPSKEIKKEVLLTKKNFASYLLDIFESDFRKALKFNKNKRITGRELKNRNKVFDKIEAVIIHNRAIISGTAKYVIKKKKGGQKKNAVQNIDREEGKYPILFNLLDELLLLYIP